jgi:hypothetical protein
LGKVLHSIEGVRRRFTAAEPRTVKLIAWSETLSIVSGAQGALYAAMKTQPRG